MATEAIEQTAPDAAAPAPKSSRLGLILTVVGVIAGSAIGLWVVAPTLVKRKTATVAAAPKAAEAPSTSVNHAIENLVLNPAGSGGTRFLMVSATFELKDGGTEQYMKDHEAEVRDRILGLLGKKSVDELTDITQRELIKQQVLDAVAPIFPKGAVLKVFFPQFVIQ